MHKLKRTARFQSWYPDEDGNKTFNPFSKTRDPRRKANIPGTPKEEAPNEKHELGRTQSEGNTISSPEQKRRSEYSAPNMPLASTAPEHPTDGSSSAANEDIAGSSGDGEKSNGSSKPTENSEESKTVTIATNDTSKGENEIQRNGHLGGFLRNRSKEKDIESQPIPDEPEAEKSKKPEYTVWSQIRYSLFNSWINILIVCAPVGIGIHFVPGINPIAIFVVNFIAIIPLAGTLSYATEEIALRTGETIGGLLNASFGNAVELIVSIIALFQRQIVIVQTSLIGSMLSNLLLVMGMCFFFGGLNRVQQHFNVTVAQTATSLLALAIGSLIIPTAFNRWANLPDTTSDDQTVANLITQLSRGTSILLLVVYGCYLFFQLRTHVDIYNAPSEKSPKKSSKVGKGDAFKAMAQAGGMSTTGAGAAASGDIREQSESKDDEEPQLSLLVALITLAWTTVLVAVCAEFMVEAIQDVVTQTGVSETFIGLILLPIVGNAAEHATAVTVACKDKMDLAIGVAVGSSMQIALLVLPLVVTIGWIAHIDAMDLNFDPFEIIVLFVSVLLVNYLIADGKSHWLEGVLLQTLYLIITLSAWFWPNTSLNPQS